MIGLAWLMSSARWRVNWRLVMMALGLQFLLAAIFFNSQNWTFPRHVPSFPDLAAAVDEQRISVEQAEIGLGLDGNRPLKIGGLELDSYESLRDAVADQRIDWESIPALNGGIQVPRFPGGIVFYGVDSFFQLIQQSVAAGASFVFRIKAPEDVDPLINPLMLLSSFAFGILPTIIFFAALMSVLYYLGVMQLLIRGMAWLMRKTLGTTGAESLAAAANVFVGHTEAPLVVRPYVASMTRSELNALMVTGFSTISGSLMAVFAAQGFSAGHLLTASLISAPAALLLAKIMQPETETPARIDDVESRMQANATNVIEAAANGASEGMKLAINIAAMLIAFLALIEMVNILLIGIGSLVGWDLSLSTLFGLLFWPLAWLMGIETGDCLAAGDLLGKKMVINEFLAYLEMDRIVAGQVEGVSISPRTETILIYALCGFSNFGAIGIQLGGIGPLAPQRKSDLAQLGLRAMLGGMLASCMTACIAGIFYGML